MGRRGCNPFHSACRGDVLVAGRSSRWAESMREIQPWGLGPWIPWNWSYRGCEHHVDAGNGTPVISKNTQAGLKLTVKPEMTLDF